MNKLLWTAFFISASLTLIIGLFASDGVGFPATLAILLMAHILQYGD